MICIATLLTFTFVYFKVSALPNPSRNYHGNNQTTPLNVTGNFESQIGRTKPCNQTTFLGKRSVHSGEKSYAPKRGIGTDKQRDEN